MKRIFYIFLLLPVLTFIVLMVINTFVSDIFPKENTLNGVCCDEKKKKLELKGMLSDKIGVKEYLSENFPEIKFSKILARTKNPSDIRKLDLPEKFVIKTNTGNGHSHVVNKGTIRRKVKTFPWMGHETRDYDYLIAKYSVIMKTDFTKNGFKSVPFLNLIEPHYKYNNETEIFMEEAFENINEFRVMMINGKINYIEVEGLEKGEHQHYTEDWLPIPHTRTNEIKPFKLKKPNCLGEILKFCKKFYKKHKIGLTRMDFYVDFEKDEFYFGEFTFSPNNCTKLYHSNFNKKFSTFYNRKLSNRNSS